MASDVVKRHPLIVILGATGTGKSNLAIQLAKSLADGFLSNNGRVYNGAEIINADAMQLYRGLPIVTNKVTNRDQEGIPHHLLDHIDLQEEPWTVQEYVREADHVIEAACENGALPIVVGGTSYYVYNLLFKEAMLGEHGDAEPNDEDRKESVEFGKEAANTWPILAASTPEIYSRLQEVDPVMASRWHPNDRRKIQRSLEIYLRTGRRASEIYSEQKLNNIEEQRQDEHTALTTNRLRYDPIIFWLEAEDQCLKDRLNARVDVMVEHGLLNEVRQMHDLLLDIQKRGLSIDKSKGIWVSIGYKELEPWVQAQVNPLTSSNDMTRMEQEGIEAVKAATRQYAKRQNRFIRLRLANTLTSTNLMQNLFLLDCSNLARWEENVFQPALEVTRSFLNNSPLPDPAELSSLAHVTLSNMAKSNVVSERVARTCEICDKVLMTEKQWYDHLSSRSHKKILQGIQRRQLGKVNFPKANAATTSTAAINE